MAGGEEVQRRRSTGEAKEEQMPPATAQLFTNKIYLTSFLGIFPIFLNSKCIQVEKVILLKDRKSILNTLQYDTMKSS